MHTRNDLSCERGYELWLLSEAKKRNPAIKTYGLMWGAPGWINNGTFYGPDMLHYTIEWLTCAEQRAAKVDYLGLHNEASQPTVEYVVQLRAALDAAGFGETQIVAMDNGNFNTDEIASARANATYRHAIGVAGLHDPCEFYYGPIPAAAEVGWSLWSSEDFSRDVTSWEDSQNYWGKALSQHYVVMNITATISWSLIWAVYSNLICIDNGLMKARWPSSGYYEVSPTIWLHAHWGQFVSPGWRFLHVPGGGSGFLDVAGQPLHGGTYVTLVPPVGDPPGLTVIIETMADRSCLHRNLSHFNITFKVRGGLPGPGTRLYVWRSTQSALFVEDAASPLTIAADSTFTVGIAPDALVTVSTVAGASHGSFPEAPIPALAPWPLPLRDDFSTYAEDAMARYFADQGGSWAVRGGALRQVSGGEPIAWAPSGDPLSIVGSEEWIDYVVSATATFAETPSASAGVTVGPQPRTRAIVPLRDVDNAERGRPRHRTPVNVGSSNAAVYAAPCATDAGEQIFSFDAASGELSSSYGDGVGCLTSCGCTASCIQTYYCGNGGCGSGNATSYRWAFDAASGALTNSAFPGLALQAFPTTGTVALTASGTGGAAQRWTFSPTTGHVTASELGVCLSQLKPTRTYVAVCGRVGAYNGFSASTTPAYCLAVYDDGEWALLVNSAPAVSGNLTSTNAPFDPGAPHRLSVSMSGDIIEAFVNGTMLAQLTDSTYAKGNAAIGSGWHSAAFTDFEVTVPPA